MHSRSSRSDSTSPFAGNECFLLRIGSKSAGEKRATVALLNIGYRIIKESTSEIGRDGGWQRIERDGPIWIVTKANDTLNR